MINAIPIIGWLLSFAFSLSLSVPFYFLWGYLGPKYFYFVPPLYQHIPFWDCVWIFMLMPILKGLLLPTLSSSSSSSGNKG